MFFSQCLLSQKAPLGAIRVAAYCFKRLKKVQVNETDICFSVDKILQDEINDQTYRVLAALLLGLVRIYSKKVDYLVHDCNEVLSKIKKFMINTNGKGPMDTLCATITIPERFELDAFDLEVSDDVGGGNITPLEEITLKDVWENDEQIGQFSLDKFQFEKFSCSLNLSSADNQIVEEDFRQSHQMNISFEVVGPSSPNNLLAGQDTSSPEKQVNLGTDLALEVLEEPVNLLSRDKQMDDEKTREQGESCEDEAQNISIERVQSCGISQEDFSVSFHGEVGPTVPFESFDESHHQVVVEEEIEARGHQMHQEAEEVHEARNSEALEEHIGESNGDNNTEQNLGLTKYVSMDGQKFHVIPITSMSIDFSPWLLDASTARPKQGATTPKDMHIPTPAAREGARFKRKRKTIIDGHSLELKSLFSKKKVKICSHKKKVKISESFQTTKTPRKLNELKSDKVASPKTPPLLSTIQSVQGPHDVTPLSPHEEGLRREQSLRNDEQLNPINDENNNNHGDVGTFSLYESLEADQSLRNNEEHSMMNEDSHSYETQNSQSSAGWTEKTREAAMDLQRSFLSLRNQKEGEVVNFSQVFGSARLFYEILVLKTTDFVDAKQEEAYGDISIRKLPKWDETFGVDGF